MSTTDTIDVSVVVPVYNEEENIAAIADEVGKALSPRFAAFELVLVDDRSTDRTWERIVEQEAAHPFVRGLRLAAHGGQSAAMLAGLRHAAGRVLVTMDGDLQNDPADIPGLVDGLADPQVDAVCGYRARRRDTVSRRVASRWANAVRNRITHDGVRDTGCSLKAFRRACAADLPCLRGVHRFMPAYFVLNGRRVREVPVHHRPRLRGQSKYTNLKRLPETIRDLFGFRWYRSRLVDVRVEERT
jgi:dolichol-phosphate mannosyltransferase